MVVSVYAIIDLAIEAQEITAGVERDASSSNANHVFIRLRQRAGHWLAVGVFRGMVLWAHSLTFDRLMFETWQPLPLAAMFVSSFVIDLLLIAGVMLRAHQDRQPTVWRWWILVVLCQFISVAGRCTPYSRISQCGALAHMSVVIVGLPYVVKCKDRNVARDDVKHGYRLMAGVGMWGALGFMLSIGNVEFPTALNEVEAIIKSMVLMFFSFLLLRLLIPAGKHAFGDDALALWSYILPPLMLALETGQVLLFLGSSVRHWWQFWALTCLHEMNSLARNTGLFLAVYVNLRNAAGRPVPQSEVAVMEERRTMLAPCDNFGEVLSPVVVSLAIAFQSLFHASGLRPAPFAEAGTVRSAHHGDTPLLLAMVFGLRIVFCWAELSIRSNARTRRYLHSSVVVQHGSPSEPAEPTATPDGLSARPQMKHEASVFKHLSRMRVDSIQHVHSQRMQWVAAMLVALQPTLLVVLAAESTLPY